MISAWGTGKSMMLILRAMLYTEEVPGNLGVIFRKEYTDLRDSTCKDFESYTQLSIDSQRSITVPSYNGEPSTILFRHLEEMNNIQNMNLGWFAIEQAEELASDDYFFKLWGRLRRSGEPSPYFKELGLSRHSGWIIGNVAGSNWIKSLWKDQSKPDLDFELIEAVTQDNAKNLSKEYIEGLEKLRARKPSIYARFVMNDWTAETEGRAFGAHFIDQCVYGDLVEPITEQDNREIYEIEKPIPGEEYTIGQDFAKHEDNFVTVVIRVSTKRVVYMEWSADTSWTRQRSRAAILGKQYNNATLVPDSTGVGDPITEDLVNAGCNVWQDPDAIREGFVFTNKSKENLIENLNIFIEGQKIMFPRIQRLIDELKEYEIKKTASGKISYGAPAGKHDDCVIGLSLACWTLRTTNDLLYWSV